MCRIFVVSSAYKKKKNGFFLKDALWGGGGTHRSWPGGRGGRPRALVAGEGRVGAMTVAKKGEGWGLVGCSKEEQVQGRGQGRVGLAVGGGARASVAGG